MKAQWVVVWAVILAAVMCCPDGCLGQGLDEHLALFEPLIGDVWVGHYVESSDSELEHVVRWESILSGQVVKSTKSVDALDFNMETYYYWDWETKAVSFLQLTSRGIVSRGSVDLDGETITLSGVGIRPGDVSEFKQTFAIRPDMTLQDCFYRQENGEWVKGHVIEYSRGAPATE